MASGCDKQFSGGKVHHILLQLSDPEPRFLCGAGCYIAPLALHDHHFRLDCRDILQKIALQGPAGQIGPSKSFVAPCQNNAATRIEYLP